MLNKFTEEQFNTLVRFQEDQYPDGLYFDAKDYLGSINCTIALIDDDLQLFIYQNNLYNEAVAIMNPVTRYLAYEKYVEKKKQYVWRLKNDNNMVISALIDGWFVDGVPAGKQYFTEEEINNSPFKPEWFDKEEAKLNV